MRVAGSLLVLAMVGLGCLGDRGDTGGTGPGGDAGPPGPPGIPAPPSACRAPDGGAAAITANLNLSSPNNGQFFTAGERAVVTITFVDSCGQRVPPANLGSTADLFVVGPRSPLQTVTAYNLLNSSPGPFRAQGLKPLADGGTPNPNMTVQPDGTVVYTLNPITTEAPGTYTASVWAIGPDPLNQMFVLADFQVGTATVEPYASGPAVDSTCASCHRNAAPGGKTYMAHIAPGFSPVGNYALDSLPIGSCKACHNNAGYSPNPLLRKVHGVHRGEHQLAPGAAHPEYGFGADTSLSAFLNVGFPAMPTGGTPGLALPASVAMEKSCTSCHTDDVWKTKPSRAACGTCHDNVFFAGALLPDGGVDPGATAAAITPPTVLGFPSGTAGCTDDASCSALSSIATCNTTTKNCELTSHPRQDDDAQCGTCHAPANGLSPVPLAHRTPYDPPVSLEGYTFQNVTVTGGTGPSGSFKVGDKPVLSFQLLDAQYQPVADLGSSAAWAGTFLVAGPTSNPQRVYGAGAGGLNMKTPAQGTLVYDPGTQTYTYTPAATWPASSIAPLNNPGAGTQANPSGSYTVWFYWARTTGGVRDAVDAQKVVAFGGAVPLQARQVVTQGACASCHGQTAGGFPHLALHGGQRKNGETCSACHSQNAFDRVVGATGAACTTSAQCPGNAAGWEACVANVCTVTVDPTPGVTVDYQRLVHSIHFARLREGYAERNNLVDPGTLQYLGFNNSLLGFQEILSPVDVRSCTNCHQDTNVTCSSSAPCGYGQSCGVTGKCVNVAWQAPTARACITCHDSGADFEHAQANTADLNGTTVESCEVCHGPDRPYSVAAEHDITSQYSSHLAYPREKE